MAEFNIEVNLQGNSRQVEAAMKRAGVASNKLTSRIKTNNARTMKSFTALSGSVTRLIGSLAVGAAFKGIVGSFRELGKATAELSTLGPVGDELQMFTDSARELGKQFGTNAASQIAAYYQTVSAGATTFAEAQSVLTVANKLALGGVTDIETATDGLTSVLNAYGLDAGMADRVSDTFFATMKAGKTTVDELSRSIGRVAPLAAGIGLTFEETGAALAQVTKSGISTKEAASALKAAFSNVLKPTTDAVTAAEELGIEFNQAALQAQGLAPFLSNIAVITGGNAEQMSKLFGSVEAVNAILALTRNSGKDFTDTFMDIRNSANATDDAVAKVKDTLDFRLSAATAELSDLAITLGRSFAPVLEKAIPIVTKFVQAISSFNEQYPGLSLLSGAVTAIGVSLLLLGAPITAAVVAISAIAAIWSEWDNIVIRFQNVWTKFANNFPTTAGLITSYIDIATEAWTGFFDIISKVGGAIGSVFDSAPEPPTRTITGQAALSKEFLGRSTGGKIQKYATGGYVSGPGSGTSDSISAMLSDGEYVINAKQTKKYEPLLEAINNNEFATGGKVENITNKYATGGKVQSTLNKYATGGKVENNYATGGKVQSTLNKYATGGKVQSTLNNYATGGKVQSTLNKYATGGKVQSTLNKYATGGKVENKYATGGKVQSTLNKYATGGKVQSTLNKYATGGKVQNYATGGKVQYFQRGGQATGGRGGRLGNGVQDFSTAGVFDTAAAQQWVNSLALTNDALTSVTNRIGTIGRKMAEGALLEDLAIQNQITAINGLVASSQQLVDTGFFSNEEEDMVAQNLSRSVVNAIQTGDFKSIGQSFVGSIQKVFADRLQKQLDTVFSSLFDSLSDSISQGISSIGSSGGGGGFGGIISSFFGGLFGGGASVANTGGVVGRNKIYSFNSGGVVPGSGSKDTVPALLTPGEVVTNPDRGQGMGDRSVTINVTGQLDPDTIQQVRMISEGVINSKPQLVSQAAANGKQRRTGLRGQTRA